MGTPTKMQRALSQGVKITSGQQWPVLCQRASKNLTDSDLADLRRAAAGRQTHLRYRQARAAVIVTPAVWGHSSIWRAIDGGWRPARIQPVRVAATGTPRIVMAR